MYIYDIIIWYISCPMAMILKLPRLAPSRGNSTSYRYRLLRTNLAERAVERAWLGWAWWRGWSLTGNLGEMILKDISDLKKDGSFCCFTFFFQGWICFKMAFVRTHSIQKKTYQFSKSLLALPFGTSNHIWSYKYRCRSIQACEFSRLGNQIPENL